MRYHDCKGDPTGMIAFFKANRLDPKMLIRYVGNRFHVLFELPANIYFAREQLKKYLSDYCEKAVGYRDQMFHDLCLDAVETEM